ncbi:DUF3718 domain-containing protein [Pseudoalteromonas tunicata]|jgi:hypothetical protein|uniref:DUF3718 domain-containing protein n=1 Tax=Pseudoalteromonas tunicata D2 TaxID=87626 RepID=A4C918_9GAMM|nr:DUF3718 domain-containing protein [Pseudoalteromonas tunicata]ATC93584.1 hypothetical protein PTUN_a0868 [Pseudoalteromonas tunicata]AXT29423.1 DUF3718 domain-containing protein [Pseudoalteromonas tunicata]EAR29083.1 hypothetical protein PTD2_08564 [Pseudoalteromonas tunicata D2]MDP4983200.1 DUF3718 domain-containing protein [Pseudoalteromonas tunicata]MDP5211800.1 DUF3718 domain-containing protein [Pseudoalteromonas tunicata]
MKKTLLSLSAFALVSISTFSANVAAEDDMSVRICEYTQIDDKSRLRSFLKDNNLKIRAVFDKIQCNGENILVFSATSKALNTGEFIIGQLPKSVVSDNLAAIKEKSPHLLLVAEERVK